MIRRAYLLPLLLLLAAEPALGDEVPPTRPAALTVELPDQLLGNTCTRPTAPGDGVKMMVCMPRDIMAGAIVGVTVVPEGQATYDELVAQMRGSFHESGGLRVISEERFAPATAPDAVGLRAEYQTGTGRKFTWSVSHDGAFTRVLVTVFNRVDRDRFEPEILASIFGPDRYPPDPSPSAALPTDASQ